MSKSKKTHLRKSCKNKRRKTMRGGEVVTAVNAQVQGSSGEVRPVEVVDQPVAVVKQPVAVVKPDEAAKPATSFWSGNWFGSDKTTTGNAVPAAAAAAPAKGWFWGGKRRRHKSRKSYKK